MMFARIFLLLGLATQLALAKPAQIILMRHAEKPDNVDDPHLTARGVERAQALPAWFTNAPEAKAFGPPVALFAPHAKHHGGVRPTETLAPLARQLKLSIQTPYFSTECAELAKDILSRPAYDGKTVVICWVHTEIPGLARALGVNNAPAKWKDSVFDRVWVIRYDGPTPKLQEVKEQLLPGDSGNKDERKLKGD